MVEVSGDLGAELKMAPTAPEHGSVLLVAPHAENAELGTWTQWWGGFVLIQRVKVCRTVHQSTRHRLSVLFAGMYCR